MAVAAQGTLVLAQGIDTADRTQITPLPSVPSPVLVPIDPLAASNVFPNAVAPNSALQTAPNNTATPASSQAVPQSPPPGPQLIFDVATGLRIDDGQATIRNTLGMTYRTQTREQLLQLSLGTAVDFDYDDISTDNVLPDADLVYVRDTGVLLLSLSASSVVSDINGSIPGPNFVFDETDVIQDDGTRVSTRLGFGFEIGRRDPIGFRFDVAYQGRDYQDTVDPDLVDINSLRYDALLRFTINPTLSFRLTGAVSDLDEDGVADTDETTRSFGAGVTWQATPLTTVDLALARTKIENQSNETIGLFSPITGLFIQRVPTGVRLNTEQEGTDANLALTHTLRNGNLGLSLGHNQTVNGPIDQISASRRMTLANGATVALSLGVGQFDDSDSFGIVNMRYTQPLPQGQQVSASLQRDGAVDQDEQNVVRTRATLGYQRPLTPVSDLSMTLGLASFDVIDGIEPDSKAADLAVIYSHQVGLDWVLNMGYQGTLNRDDGAPTDSNSVVFVNLSRRFDLRF